MNGILFIVIYLAVLIFLVACVARGIQYGRTPLHLRWELYPAPHGLVSEIRLMFFEILFLKSLWEFNRKLWFRSFPFHFGLYLLAATSALLVLDIFAGIGLRQLYRITGAFGIGLGLIGVLGLLELRLTDPELKIYTTRGDIFNLLFFLVSFGLWAAARFSPAAAPDGLQLARAIFAFDTRIEIPGLTAASLFLTSVLLAYIPMTHMAHFIAKYFTYHSVRWDDRSNVSGGSIEKRLAASLSYKPTWAAAHMKADGGRSWAEIAAANPEQEPKK
jgi:nitrate reductase gamma subunit